MTSAYPEHEADGVHEVGLASSIRAYDGGEVVEGANHLLTLVGLEVLQLQPEDLPRRHEGGHN